MLHIFPDNPAGLTCSVGERLIVCVCVFVCEQKLQV